MINFTPSRLVLARKRRGLTKKVLAELLLMSPRMIISYESGERTPPYETLEKIANILDFPINFFALPETDSIDTRFVSFRSFSRVPARSKDSSLAAGEIGIEFNTWLESKFNLPMCDIPDLRGENPEAAAMIVRMVWGLGQSPIGNLIHLLESKGVRVFSLNEGCRELDAYCFWQKETPFVFLNLEKSSERTRFDAAHELAHLVLHRHGEPQGREVEYEADEFASAFLMPRDSVLAKVPRLITIEALIELKKYYKVSLAALNFRIHKLGVSSEWHYRQLCIQISKNGFHVKEPDGISRESSQLLALVISLLKVDGRKLADIASQLSIYPEDLSELLFGLVAVPLRENSDRRFEDVKALNISASKQGSPQLELLKF